jgi:hypothetical protein
MGVKTRKYQNLERQVTRLKRELSAAKRDARSQLSARLKAVQREYDHESQYIKALEDRVLELERYNVGLAMEAHLAKTAWSRLGTKLYSVISTPPSIYWYNFKQPVLNWYAVKRLSDDQIQAMTEAGYDVDPVKRAKVARRYWEYDRQERRNPRHDRKTVVVYRQSLRQEIVNGITQRFVHFQEGLAGYYSRAARAANKLARRASITFDGSEQTEVDDL